jgi:hypothetical protein
VILSGLIVASAAGLDVDGGALQVFRLDVEVPASIATTSSTIAIETTTTPVSGTTVPIETGPTAP